MPDPTEPNEDEYVLLTGDDIPYHLRSDAAPLAECDVCHRMTWSADTVDTTCDLPQPNGERCQGTLRPPS